MFRKYLLCSLVLVFALNGMLHAQYLEFVENKGQWDSKVKFCTNMKGGSLFLQSTGYKVQLDDANDSKAIAEYFGGHHEKSDSAIHANEKGSTSKPDSSLKSLILHSHAYEVSFLNANTQAEIEPEKPLTGVSNFFLGTDSTKWAAGCRTFTAVIFKNVYKNIDVRYYSNNGTLKYDVIVKPGADISKLALQYDGLDKLSINKYGNIVLKTSVGEAYEQKPYSYQAGNDGKVKVDAKYVIEGNTVKFKLGNYDPKTTLIIDPTLIFSTFIGSTSDNWGYSATYDGSGNFYAGGIVFGNGYRYRQTNGAYQTTFGGGDNAEKAGGGYDVAISKFNSVGSQRLYATYLGGNGDEQPHSLIVDGQGNLIISGRTSSSNFPSTAKPYGTGGGLFDIFLSKLNPDGTQLVASRIFGGGDRDGVNINPKYQKAGAGSTRQNYGDDARSEVIVDSSDNIYLASCTESSDFPLTANAIKTTLGGKQDGVFIKAAPDLQTVYTSTYIGGNADDAAFVLAFNPKDHNVYVGGATTSTSGLASNASNAGGIVSSSYGGGTDGFISILNNSGSGNLLVKTVYIGSSGTDMVYGLQFDKIGFPYIMGTTTKSFPVSNAAWSEPQGKQFITKLKPDLTGVVYSTNFGTSNSEVPNISPTAFLVDVCENVYISGWGGSANGEYLPSSTFGLTTTPNALANKTDGSDFYFFVLQKNASSQLFGSFFGTFDPQAFGEHVDGGTSRFNKRGVIYQALCANCKRIGLFPTGSNGPTVWSSGNPASSGAECNEAALKIAFEFAGVISSVRSSVNGIVKNSGCVPLQMDFTDTIALGKQYVWDFGDGSKRDTTTSATDSHLFNNVGTYRVQLISIDSSTCNVADTSYTTIRVRDNEAKLSATYSKLPPCQSLNFEFTNTSVAPAGLPFKANSFTWDFGDGSAPVVTNELTIQHAFPASGTYHVVLRLTDTNYCNAPDSLPIILRVSDILKAQFITPAIGCAPYNASFENNSLGGQNFTWDFGDGSQPVSTNEIIVTHFYPNPGSFTIHLSATDPYTCNTSDDTTMTISVFSSPTAAFTYGPTTPKENTPIDFFNGSTGAVRYHWDFGDGDTLVTTSLATPVSHQYNATGTFKACLTVYNENGCSDDTCMEVSAVVSPLVDVPNAFSPNNDGVNDVVSVKGYGITQMNWKIYNRWGQLLFQSTSTTNGWDGKRNGVLQPQDVYTYVLDVSFSNDGHYRKTGDITLLR